MLQQIACLRLAQMERAPCAENGMRSKGNLDRLLLLFLILAFTNTTPPSETDRMGGKHASTTKREKMMANLSIKKYFPFAP